MTFKTNFKKPKSKFKGTEIQRLIARVTHYCNLYIRLRDTDENGYGKCCTCGKFKHFKQLDAGHYISCGQYPTQFDEKNIHAQCRDCNRFKAQNIEHGKKAEYALFMLDKYGRETIDLLNWKSKSPKKKDKFELVILKEHYKEQAKKLARTKNFEVTV